MKTRNSLLITLIAVFFISIATPGITMAQSKGYKFIENNKRGIARQPRWVKWTKLKTFKRRRCHRLGLNAKDMCYLFVVEAIEKTPPFERQDIEKLATLAASTRLSELILTEVEETVSKGRGT